LWWWPLIYKHLKRKFPISTCRFWCPMFWLFIIIIIIIYYPYVWFKLFKRLGTWFSEPSGIRRKIEIIKKTKTHTHERTHSAPRHTHAYKIYYYYIYKILCTARNIEENQNQNQKWRSFEMCRIGTCVVGAARLAVGRIYRCACICIIHVWINNNDRWSRCAPAQCSAASVCAPRVRRGPTKLAVWAVVAAPGVGTAAARAWVSGVSSDAAGESERERESETKRKNNV